jgi:DNA (cytosine-5)-methyltransferase 1
MNFATLFSGFEGYGIGAMAAGHTHVWGIEKDAKIAAVANANLGGGIIVADIVDIDPHTLPKVDLLHASPPCPSFSIASQSQETENDLALAHQIARFVEVLQPQAFTLENVSMYRKSESWQIIYAELMKHYWLSAVLVNAADYGVPQSRRRFVVRATKGLLRPMFGQAKPVGWYDAVADLVAELPSSSFAPWQLARLPEKYHTFMMAGGGNSNFKEAKHGKGVYQPDQPAPTVMTHLHGGCSPKAFIAEGSNAEQIYSYSVKDDSEPYFTVTASDSKKVARAWLKDGGRVVRMTPRAAARFQSFPDSYELPEDKRLAHQGIGNAVPPLLARRIVESLGV